MLAFCAQLSHHIRPNAPRNIPRGSFQYQVISDKSLIKLKIKINYLLFSFFNILVYFNKFK